MVTAVDAVLHAADEPGGGLVQDGRAAGSRVPGDVGELVDVVAGLAAEEPGQVVLVAAEQVDGEPFGVRSATRKVRLALDSQTMNRAGSIEHCEPNPTRHPARSPSASVVTTYIGGSSRSVNGSSSVMALPVSVRVSGTTSTSCSGPLPRSLYEG